jgi:hypothetical protein
VEPVSVQQREQPEPHWRLALQRLLTSRYATVPREVSPERFGAKRQSDAVLAALPEQRDARVPALMLVPSA